MDCKAGLQRINHRPAKRLRRKPPEMDCRAPEGGLQCNAKTAANKLAASASFLRHQPAKHLAQDRRSLRAEAVFLAVLGLLAAIAVRGLLVPLALGDDVADLVVGQADD